ncbi:MAG: hypothetical protein DI599_02235 [Pseudomonas kuykendallii]|uniref:B3/B4 tRNA-binding domain-containing protein n=2 Tax=Pseudomonas kuykendallii TaxID=1007099 RepID=A0A2W5DDN0_9PSED|nr:MAG: hypothetical protein DI599_02235 [Pseudomonas kuykendallii]
MFTRLEYELEVQKRFPQLRSRALLVEGIDSTTYHPELTAVFLNKADKRIAGTTEATLPEIQAWRRAFSDMGFRPTQYRCASESLLRRYRKNGELPAIHPIIDLCNVASLAFAIPVAVFDVDRITGALTVKHANGTEVYESFNCSFESPEPGEIIYADDGGRAHARRWTHRQSGWSAIRTDSHNVLIVAEALHDRADADVLSLTASLRESIVSMWPSSNVVEVSAL